MCERRGSAKFKNQSRFSTLPPPPPPPRWTSNQQPEQAAAPDDHHSQYPALVGFLSDPSAEQWSARISGWNPDYRNICEWAGITCEAFSRNRGYPQVVGINIARTPGPGELHSTIPTELGAIDTLRELMAYYDCDLVGGIHVPTELAGLPHLKKLLSCCWDTIHSGGPSRRDHGHIDTQGI